MTTERQQRAGQERPRARFRILVVDDEPDLEPLINQMFRPNIRSGEYTFQFAKDGEEALQLLNGQDRFEMLITDINMPNMDGITLLGHIGKTNPNIKSVVVSAYGDMRNIRAAMNQGAFDFITKPVDLSDLQITIERTQAHVREWQEVNSSRDQLKSIRSELQLASNMQQAILPTEFPKDDSYNVYGSMLPARNVGGDFFDVIRLDGDRLGLAVADVSDKGVQAAMFMMSSRTLLKGAAIGMDSPDLVLNEVNTLLHADNKTIMFVTVLYAVYDPGSGELIYANGGHCSPMMVHADGSCTDLPQTGGVVLGLAPQIQYNQARTVLKPGDTVIMYSDGVSEARNPEGQDFGTEGIAQLFEGRPPTGAREANEAVLQALDKFTKGTPQSDDITCLALHRSQNSLGGQTI